MLLRASSTSLRDVAMFMRMWSRRPSRSSARVHLDLRVPDEVALEHLLGLDVDGFPRLGPVGLGGLLLGADPSVTALRSSHARYVPCGLTPFTSGMFRHVLRDESWLASMYWPHW